MRRWPLILLGGYTFVALAGYVLFTLPPHGPANLARIGEFAPSLVAFYGVAFRFFAQTHVWLTGFVLGWYLGRMAGVRWLGVFAAVYAVSFLSEFIGTGYGVPFGPYGYTDLLGPKWFGRVPWLIPLSWFTMALPAYVLARAAYPGRLAGRLLLGAFLLTAWDLALDPAMSYLTTYWVWGEAGPYYGMPLVNLLGWFVTGLALMGLFEALGAGDWADRLSRRWLTVYYLLVLAMPLGMVIANGLWDAVGYTAAAVGAGLGLVAWRVRGRATRPGAEEPTPDARTPDPATQALVQEIARCVPVDIDAFFADNSRSFSFAARWFDPPDRKRVTRVYAFCRFTDDLVDVPEGRCEGDLRARLTTWQTLVRGAYEGTPTGIGWLDALMHDSARFRVPFDVIQTLIDGVASDLGPVRLRTMDELWTYGYRVASVVGLWICHLLGVRDVWRLERAIALGQALQLTNILRDVGEDLRTGRVYLPAECLAAHGLSVDDLRRMQAQGRVTPAYRKLVDALMAEADARYARAWEAIPHLPGGFGRAVAVAADVYRGIHRRIRANGYDNLTQRARTTTAEKCGLAARALFRLARRRWHQRHHPKACSGPSSFSPALGEEAPTPGGSSGRFRPLHLLVLLLLGPSTLAAQPVVDHPAEPVPPETLLTSRPHPRTAMTHRPVVDTLRDYYLASADEEDYIDRAEALIATQGADAEPVVRAYGAAFEVMKAKHAFWPFDKYRHVQRGLPVLDALVEEHPDDAEIRFLRLLSCYYLPGLFGRSETVSQDIAALGRLLPAARDAYPPTLYRLMITFLLDTGRLPAATQQALAALRPDIDETTL
ncbi:carotenoid biosynthesis protein [Rhodocaloribacter litoris]|uniref:carotenoid biosynthesis protein n=1 Tax=Rhodocaloribacter litoris TaxID=2558931 RepID=UPI0014245BB3|nr:carotenoid biosynthesis protein [Rhodocaloribacter litoris]QXD15519.1 carotenoid biosynthesis protein [Rhodocaloribacter litoris]